jgi:hypothetical protein
VRGSQSFCSLIALSILDQFVDRFDIFERSSAPLVLSENDVFESEKIFHEWNIVVSPFQIVLRLGLETPIAAKLRCAHLAFPAILIFLCPYVLTPHRKKILD